MSPRAAALRVCGHARDTDDARLLLVCGVFGPNGARCEVRFGHIGQHAGTDSKGVWRQW